VLKSGVSDMNESHAKLVLASGSPRRLSLLEQAGLKPDLLAPANIDETPRKSEMPRKLARRLAYAKAEAASESLQVAQLGPHTFVLSADTVVALGRRVLAKAETIDEAAANLRLLSGRGHRVYTTVCLRLPNGRYRDRTVETRVRMKRLSRQDLESYLASGEWRGKAGGYAIQGRAEAFVQHINGSYSAVVGLPLYETVSLLSGGGYPVYFAWFASA